MLHALIHSTHGVRSSRDAASDAASAIAASLLLAMVPYRKGEQK